MQHMRAHSMTMLLLISAASGVAYAQVPPAVLPPLALPSSEAPAVAAPALAMPVATGETVAAAPAPQNPQGAAVAEPAATFVPVTSGKTYSYGRSNLSVLFLPTQIEQLKTTIRRFEDSNKSLQGVAAPEAVVTTAAPPEVIEEPSVYPVFYLSSIVYHGPKDWSVWVSGYKITSGLNDTDITVSGISKDSVTLTWAPTFNRAVKLRHERNAFADAEPIKNKLSPSQPVKFDEDAGTVSFTLRPNQAFVVGYFKVFEGYVDSPKLGPLPAPDPSTMTSIGVNSPGAVSTSVPRSGAPVNPNAIPGNDPALYTSGAASMLNAADNPQAPLPMPPAQTQP